MELRNASPQDKDRCLDLVATLRGTTGIDATRPDGTGFEELLDHSRGAIIVAVEDDTILGMATVSYNLALRYEGEYCQLEELIVDPTARGKNVGGLLVQATVANARERGCKEMGLYLMESTEHNQPFYKKYGFDKVGSEMRQRL